MMSVTITYKDESMSNATAEMDLASDLLDGAHAIARFTGLPRSRVNRLLVLGLLPAFKIGAGWLARKSQLREVLRAPPRPRRRTHRVLRAAEQRASIE
jgi:hypothetical protein